MFQWQLFIYFIVRVTFRSRRLVTESSVLNARPTVPQSTGPHPRGHAKETRRLQQRPRRPRADASLSPSCSSKLLMLTSWHLPSCGHHAQLSDERSERTVARTRGDSNAPPGPLPVSDVLVLPLLPRQRVSLSTDVKSGAAACLVRHAASRLLHPAAKSSIFQLLINSPNR